ncbi:energy transducer TonB [Crocinitomix catalasitica]|uniref:energy transducer TonB n=1 Tax=Crocinitomix catalasitica TaxID=184607 RepID=UPI0004850D50|nr:M56 family metallopeptidase [Crocinitomix catalasitica]
MNNLTWYFIEFNLIIAALYIGLLILKNFIDFKIQRAILFASPLVLLGLLLFKTTEVAHSFIVQLPVVNVGEAGATVAIESISNTWGWLSLWNIYWLGVVIAGVLLIIRTAKVFLFFLNHNFEKVGNLKVYAVEDVPSFSFFRYIQITPNIDAEQRDIILEHEMLHNKKSHSLEIILFELFHVFTWFNPAVYFAKRYLVDLHEYEVDQQLYTKYNVNYMQFLLAYSLGTSSNTYLLTNQFYNVLTLKKRIKKMKTKTKNYKGLILMFPILLLTLGMVQCTEEKVEIVEEEIVDIPEVEPSYPGGEAAMAQFIGDNIKYPAIDVENGVSGIAYTQLVINKDGSVDQVKVVRGVSETIDAEAKRVVELMDDWTPGQQDGKAVAVRYVLPINFQLSEEN